MAAAIPIVRPSSVTPNAPGTGSVGTSVDFMRADAVIPQDSTKADLVGGVVPANELPASPLSTNGNGDAILLPTSTFVGINTNTPTIVGSFDGGIDVSTDGGTIGANLVRIEYHNSNASYRSVLQFVRSGGTQAAPTTVPSGALLGSIIWKNYATSSYANNIEIRGICSGTVSGSLVPTSLAVSTNGVTALTVNRSQNTTLGAASTLAIPALANSAFLGTNSSGTLISVTKRVRSIARSCLELRRSHHREHR